MVMGIAASNCMLALVALIDILKHFTAGAASHDRSASAQQILDEGACKLLALVLVITSFG